MGTERFKNQKGIVNPGALARTNFTIIGAGAIGSFFTESLGKMGASKMKIWDHDKIEDHNFSNQKYPLYCMGLSKVIALKQILFDYAGVDLGVNNGRWDKTTTIDDESFIVSCVDSMATRKEIWERIKSDPKVLYYIDGRMGALVYKVYAVDMSCEAEKAFYEESLHDDASAVEERCAFKSIIFTVNGVVGEMLNLVKKIINKEQRASLCVRDFVTDAFVHTRYDDVVDGFDEDDEPEADMKPVELATATVSEKILPEIISPKKFTMPDKYKDAPKTVALKKGKALKK